MVFDFVKTSDPKIKVHVSDDLDELEDTKNIEFVYGIGLMNRLSEIGIKGITAQDVLRDIIIDKGWDSNKISRHFLPLRKNGYIPYFKHLKQGGFLDENGKLDENNKVKEFNKAFINKINGISQSSFEPSAMSYKNKRAEINQNYASFEELQKSNNLFHTLIYTPLLEENKINLQALGKFLKANLDTLTSSKNGTHYRKLICLYDYLYNR